MLEIKMFTASFNRKRHGGPGAQLSKMTSTSEALRKSCFQEPQLVPLSNVTIKKKVNSLNVNSQEVTPEWCNKINGLAQYLDLQPVFNVTKVAFF